MFSNLRNQRKEEGTERSMTLEMRHLAEGIVLRLRSLPQQFSVQETGNWMRRTIVDFHSVAVSQVIVEGSMTYRVFTV